MRHLIGDIFVAYAYCLNPPGFPRLYRSFSRGRWTLFDPTRLASVPVTASLSRIPQDGAEMTGRSRAHEKVPDQMAVCEALRQVKRDS